MEAGISVGFLSSSLLLLMLMAPCVLPAAVVAVVAYDRERRLFGRAAVPLALSRL